MQSQLRIGYVLLLLAFTLVTVGCSSPRLVTGGTLPPESSRSVKIFLGEEGRRSPVRLAAQALIEAGYDVYLADDLTLGAPSRMLSYEDRETRMMFSATDTTAGQRFPTSETDLIAIVRGRAWTGHVEALGVDLVDASSGRLYFTADILGQGRTDNEVALRYLTLALLGEAPQQRPRATQGSSRVRW